MQIYLSISIKLDFVEKVVPSTLVNRSISHIFFFPEKPTTKTRERERDEGRKKKNN